MGNCRRAVSSDFKHRAKQIPRVRRWLDPTQLKLLRHHYMGHEAKRRQDRKANT